MRHATSAHGRVLVPRPRPCHRRRARPGRWALPLMDRTKLKKRPPLHTHRLGEIKERPFRCIELELAYIDIDGAARDMADDDVELTRRVQRERQVAGSFRPGQQESLPTLGATQPPHRLPRPSRDEESASGPDEAVREFHSSPYACSFAPAGPLHQGRWSRMGSAGRCGAVGRSARAWVNAVWACPEGQAHTSWWPVQTPTVSLGGAAGVRTRDA